MFVRFTDRARKVMALANQEAQHMQHFYIGTEHILLGLVKEGTGVGANVLRNLGVDLPTVQREVESLLAKGAEPTRGKLPLSPRTKSVIEFARAEAKKLNHNYVGTEHLLLGLLREEDGVAAHVLMNLGVELRRARLEVLMILGADVDAKQGIIAKVRAAHREGDDRSEPDLQSVVKQCLRFDERLKKLTDEKDKAVIDGEYEKAADLRVEAILLSDEKTRAIRGIVERETALAALLNNSVGRLPDNPITAGSMVLAMIATDTELAERLRSVMEQLRAACEEP